MNSTLYFAQENHWRIPKKVIGKSPGNSGKHPENYRKLSGKLSGNTFDNQKTTRFLISLGAPTWLGISSGVQRSSKAWWCLPGYDSPLTLLSTAARVTFYVGEKILSCSWQEMTEKLQTGQPGPAAPDRSKEQQHRNYDNR